METIRGLLTRFRQSGLLLLIGFILILYISLGLVYWQQNTQQTTLTKQIAQISPTLARPLASIQPLEEGLNKVNAALAEVSDERTAIARLVSMAEKSGISVGEVGKLGVPSPGFSTVTVGGNTFQLISFGGIRVQGVSSNVTAFLTDLDSGKTLENMVLKRVTISYTEIPFTVNETEQRTEFNTVVLAVKKMMTDLGLSSLNMTRDAGNTTANMSAFPGGVYALYSNNLTGTVVNYVAVPKTKYYYTVAVDGAVRQFSGPDIATAIEFPSGKGPRMETIAIIDVDIYTRSAKK